MKTKLLFVLALVSMLMASCKLLGFLTPPGIKFVNESNYEMYVFQDEVKLKNNGDVTPHWNVRPKSTTENRAVTGYSRVEDFMTDGVLRVTFVKKSDVDKYSWSGVIDGKMFACEYVVTKDNIRDYLIDERTLQFTYPIPEDKAN